MLSVVYYRDEDPTTLLSPVPFHGSYYQKLEAGELDKGSEEVGGWSAADADDGGHTHAHTQARTCTHTPPQRHTQAFVMHTRKPRWKRRSALAALART